MYKNMERNNLFELINKFALLTNEQYSAVIKNPAALAELEREKLLDEFYKSMPNIPVEEIYNMVRREIETKKELPKFAISELYGDELLPSMLKEFVIKKTLFDETYTNKEASVYSDYIYSLTLNKLVNDYINSLYYNETKLKQFIFLIKEFFNYYYEFDLDEDDKKELGYLLLKVSPIMETMLKSIFTSNIFVEEKQKAIFDAYKLRSSDLFDFIKDRDVWSKKPVKIDYDFEPIELLKKYPKSDETTRVDIKIPNNKYLEETRKE